MNRYALPSRSLLPAIVLSLGCSAAAQAQEEIEEVVVTAQKREQRLIDVPVAVSAFSKDFLKDYRVDSVDDLVRYTPGLTGYNYGVSNPIMVIRGLSGNDFGSGADATFGVYVNDVFTGRKTTSINDIIDIERVEVVKGPQGTLFGRNSTAGAVSITTNRPGPDYEAEIAVKAGNYNLWQADAAINIPINDTLYFRGAVRGRTRDGYVKNIVDGNEFPDDDETVVGRASLRYVPSDNLDIEVAVDGHFHNGNTPAVKSSYRIIGAAFGLSPQLASAILSPGEKYGKYEDIASNLPDRGVSGHKDDQDIAMVSGHIEWDVSEDLSVTSITAYRQYDVDFGDDDDGTPYTFLHTFQAEQQHQFSQEVRLNGKWNKLDWFLGASILDEKIDVLGRVHYDESLYLIGPRTLVEERVITNADNFGWAIYGDATYAITDRLNFSAGVRYSDDNKDFTIQIPTDPVNGFNIVLYPTADVPVSLSDSFSAWQPRFAIDYHWNDYIMTYAGVSRGFRAGGYNNYAVQAKFDPEYVWSYEVGAKAQSADGRFAGEVAGFHYTYDDLQVLLPIGGAFIVQNAAQASGEGMELSVNAEPIDGVTFFSNLTWLNTEYDKFIVSPTDDRSGNELTRAPDIKANVGGQYKFPLFGQVSGFIRADWYYTSKFYFNSTNSAFVTQDPYSLINGAFGIEGQDGHWRVTVFGDNLLNERYLLSAGGLFGDTTVRAPPRYYGVEFSYRM